MSLHTPCGDGADLQRAGAAPWLREASASGSGVALHPTQPHVPWESVRGEPVDHSAMPPSGTGSLTVTSARAAPLSSTRRSAHCKGLGQLPSEPEGRS